MIWLINKSKEVLKGFKELKGKSYWLGCLIFVLSLLWPLAGTIIFFGFKYVSKHDYHKTYSQLGLCGVIINLFMYFVNIIVALI